MIEIISKISGILKASHIPFFLLSVSGSIKEIVVIRKKSVIDEVPGDNFPYIVGARFINRM